MKVIYEEDLFELVELAGGNISFHIKSRRNENRVDFEWLEQVVSTARIALDEYSTKQVKEQEQADCKTCRNDMHCAIMGKDVCNYLPRQAEQP